MADGSVKGPPCVELRGLYLLIYWGSLRLLVWFSVAAKPTRIASKAENESMGMQHDRMGVDGAARNMSQ